MNNLDSYKNSTIDENMPSSCQIFNALLIPVIENDVANPPLYIPDAKKVFLGFFSGDKYTSYEGFNGPVLVRCKAFNAFSSGFTTIYTIRIDNLKEQLFEKNFVLTDKEFKKLPKIFEYPFLTLKGSNQKEKYSKMIILKTTELFTKLSEFYSKCNVNSRLWYLVMTALIRPSSIHSSNWLLYAFLLESKTTASSNCKTGSGGIISINTSQLWPLKFLRKDGYEKVLRFSRDFHYFAEKLHEKGTSIFEKLNRKTKGARQGAMPNMLFFETITKYFPSVYDVINENECNTNEIILPEFEKNIKYYDSEFINDLASFCKQSVQVTSNVDKKSLQGYKYDDDSNSCCKKWMTAKTAQNQLMDIHKKFKKHNLTRTLCNLTWARTAIYSKRKYFFSRTNPLDEVELDIPFPLNTPFLFSSTVENPNKLIFSHVVNADKLDAPFKTNKDLHKRILAFLNDSSEYNFILYSKRIYDIIATEQYAFNEQIINNYPIYAIPFDIDIYDKFFIMEYAEGNSMDKRITMRSKLIEIIIKTFNVLGLKDISEKNAQFVLFESLHKKDEPIHKLGFRLIVRTANYVLANTSVALNLTKVANFLMSLDTYFPGPCLDEEIFNKRGQYLRLPLNCKRSSAGELVRPLIPLITDHSLCFVPSVGLIHHKHKGLSDKVKVVDSAPNVDSCSVTQTVLDSTIAKRMIQNKFKTMSTKAMEDYTESVRKLVLPEVKKEMSASFPNFSEDLLFVERKGISNVYVLASNLKGVCLKKKHIDESTNPCSIYCFINEYNGIITASCTQFCFGSDCKSSRMCSVDLPPHSS